MADGTGIIIFDWIFGAIFIITGIIVLSFLPDKKSRKTHIVDGEEVFQMVEQDDGSSDYLYEIFSRVKYRLLYGIPSIVFGIFWLLSRRGKPIERILEGDIDSGVALLFCYVVVFILAVGFVFGAWMGRLEGNRIIIIYGKPKTVDEDGKLLSIQDVLDGKILEKKGRVIVTSYIKKNDRLYFATTKFWNSLFSKLVEFRIPEDFLNINPTYYKYYDEDWEDMLVLFAHDIEIIERKDEDGIERINVTPFITWGEACTLAIIKEKDAAAQRDAYLISKKLQQSEEKVVNLTADLFKERRGGDARAIRMAGEIIEGLLLEERKIKGTLTTKDIITMKMDVDALREYIQTIEEEEETNE